MLAHTFCLTTLVQKDTQHQFGQPKDLLFSINMEKLKQKFILTKIHIKLRRLKQFIRYLDKESSAFNKIVENYRRKI